MQTKRKQLFTYALLILFVLLYISIGTVSICHAINFFSVTNKYWSALMLAISFEIGQSVVLFTLLLNKSKKKLSWILMIILTIVQILGNVYSCYQYSVTNHYNDIDFFTKSILFFLKDTNSENNLIITSYITGAILPIVSLCITSMIVDVSKIEKDDTFLKI